LREKDFLGIGKDVCLASYCAVEFNENALKALTSNDKDISNGCLYCETSKSSNKHILVEV
jgi:hypothetical protein